MCGIAGVIGANTGDNAGAAPMIERIAHRGPNGIRVEDGRTKDGAGWSVGHARLSIIDLEGGWQPLHAAGGAVIGNGEIYNYVELIEEFGLQGRLATGSDFEPLLHLYAQEGPAALKRLRGMYALCLIGGDGRVWLARDGFGIKPLYWRQDGGDSLAFASEPRAFGLAAQPSGELAGELLSLNYTLGEETPFPGVRRLAPGAVVEVRNGRILPPAHSRKGGNPSRASAQADPSAWTPAFAGMSRQTEALRKLDAVLEDSVRVHQRSDVPYGLFLSGGIDSAVIATMMSRLNARPVVAFTCGFTAPGARDERGGAERVARALNLDWRETTFTEEDFWRIAPQVAWAFDDPTADYAALPTYKLAQAAKNDLTVVLSGEGGDELFAGYGRYRRALRPAWLGGRPAQPQIDAAFVKDDGALARWTAIAQQAGGRTPLQRAQTADVATWLPNDLLLKLDRCLMANGLEGRTPFLDREVAAFAAALPDRMKVRGRYGKWILRQWLAGACPAAEPWARKKGFTVPVAAWIGPRAADLGPRIAALKTVRETCDADAVAAVFNDPARAKSWWPLLFFGLWSLIHVDQAEPQTALKVLLGEA